MHPFVCRSKITEEITVPYIVRILEPDFQENAYEDKTMSKRCTIYEDLKVRVHTEMKMGFMKCICHSNMTNPDF